MKTITKAERDAIMARENRLRQFCLDQGFTNKRNGWTSYKTEQVAHLNPPTNEECSAVEVFDFVTNPPNHYFCYVNEAAGLATTWTGDTLGQVTFGRPWRDNMGAMRVPIRVQTINGRVYSGTYFKSSGDYARIRAMKS